jgi:hypothetical protein
MASRIFFFFNRRKNEEKKQRTTTGTAFSLFSIPIAEFPMIFSKLIAGLTMRISGVRTDFQETALNVVAHPLHFSG